MYLHIPPIALLIIIDHQPSRLFSAINWRKRYCAITNIIKSWRYCGEISLRVYLRDLEQKDENCTALWSVSSASIVISIIISIIIIISISSSSSSSSIIIIIITTIITIIIIISSSSSSSSITIIIISIIIIVDSVLACDTGCVLAFVFFLWQPSSSCPLGCLKYLNLHCQLLLDSGFHCSRSWGEKYQIQPFKRNPPLLGLNPSREI